MYAVYIPPEAVSTLHVERQRLKIVNTSRAGRSVGLPVVAVTARHAAPLTYPIRVDNIILTRVAAGSGSAVARVDNPRAAVFYAALAELARIYHVGPRDPVRLLRHVLRVRYNPVRNPVFSSAILSFAATVHSAWKMGGKNRSRAAEEAAKLAAGDPVLEFLVLEKFRTAGKTQRKTRRRLVALENG